MGTLADTATARLNLVRPLSINAIRAHATALEDETYHENLVI